MSRPIPARRAASLPSVLLAGVALLSTGCMPTHNVPLYNLWVVNTGSEDRILVLGSDEQGSSASPDLLVPADGTTRSTPGSVISGPAQGVAAVLVYDLDCVLVESMEMRVGSYLLTLTDERATLEELARAMEPTGAELATPAESGCTG